MNAPGESLRADGMRALVRRFDWRAAGLGDPAGWPATLRVIVNVMLDSPIPMSVVWGERRIFLYNDANIPLLGDRHPAALGLPLEHVWPEIWSHVGPLIDRARAGESFHEEDMPLTVRRNGRLEPAWFTFYYAPLRDDDGVCQGMYSSVVETTAHVQAERRKALLLSVADALRGTAEPAAMLRQVTTLLGRHLGASQVMYGETDPLRDTIVFHSNYTDGSATPPAAGVPLLAYGERVMADILAGETVVIEDADADSRTCDPQVRAAYRAAGARALVAVPLGIRDGRIALLAANHAEARAWMPEEIALLAEVAQRTRGAVEQAHALSTLRQLTLELESDVATRTAELLQSQQAAMRVARRQRFTLEAAEIGDWEYEFLIDRVAYHSLRHDQCFGYQSLRDEWNFAIFMEHVHPGDRERVAAWMGQSVALRDECHVEFRVVWPNGEVHWLALHGSFYDDGGWKMGGIVYEISERKRAELALAEAVEESERARRLYETILSTTPDLVYVFDLEHRFTYANRVLLQMWGKTAEEALGRTCWELGYEPWHAEMHDREIEQVKATGQPIRGVVPFNGAFGRRLYDYIFMPVFGPDGEVEAVAGTTRDVTELKEVEEALREAHRRKDEFLAMLAHELRNPLAPISAAASLMEMAPLNEERLRQIGAIISRQSTHMSGLIDDLMDVSRVTRGLIVLNREGVDLRTAVAEAVEQVRPMIDTHKHALDLRLADGPALVHGDRKRLIQVLANLLNNAAKYTPDGGAIVLELAAGEGGIVLTVSDNGIGMDAKLLTHVFELFAQGARALDRKQGGLGLGLALVKSLVELHGGSVAAESDGEGRGSRFTLRLPAAE